MNGFAFSSARVLAVLVKEFIQVRRDRLTFGMMIGIPVMQLVLFGFAINADPKALPTAALVADSSPYARSFLAAMVNSGYFEITRRVASEAKADELLESGAVQFVVNIPQDFARRLQRGERPAILVEADATDPAATSNAISALQMLSRTALTRDLAGPLAAQIADPPPFNLRLHRRYNPEGITQYNVVPGLMGVVLTMTMVIMTALGMTRERERGTMEALLALPVRPAEVMLGKILPYILIGYVQVLLVLITAHGLFGVPIVGSVWLLLAVAIVFITANLAVGFTFSTVARNQLQAMQMAVFFFLPSIILSGFMFPFRGMPEWAQWLGEVLPLTHFLRMIRGILLKGSGMEGVWPHLWPLIAFTLAVMIIALARYRRTLD
jgi:ABC-2 type transport system permease protein